jgi:hypothetical protein
LNVVFKKIFWGLIASGPPRPFNPAAFDLSAAFSPYHRGPPNWTWCGVLHTTSTNKFLPSPVHTSTYTSLLVSHEPMPQHVPVTQHPCTHVSSHVCSRRPHLLIQPALYIYFQTSLLLTSSFTTICSTQISMTVFSLLELCFKNCSLQACRTFVYSSQTSRTSKLAPHKRLYTHPSITKLPQLSPLNISNLSSPLPNSINCYFDYRLLSYDLVA